MNDKQRQKAVLQAAVLLALLQAAKLVLVPHVRKRKALPFDLCLDEGGRITRLKCKLGLLRGGEVRFDSRSNSPDGRPDAFAVWCPETGKAYLVPAQKCGLTSTRLLVTPSQKGQARSLLADDYELPCRFSL